MFPWQKKTRKSPLLIDGEATESIVTREMEFFLCLLKIIKSVEIYILVRFRPKLLGSTLYGSI